MSTTRRRLVPALVGVGVLTLMPPPGSHAGTAVPAAVYTGFIGPAGPPPCPFDSNVGIPFPFSCAFDFQDEARNYTAQVTVSGGGRPLTDVIAEMSGFGGIPSGSALGRVEYWFAVDPLLVPSPASEVPVRIIAFGEAMASGSGSDEFGDANATANATVSIEFAGSPIQLQAYAESISGIPFDDFAFSEVVTVPVATPTRVTVESFIRFFNHQGQTEAQAVADPTITIDPTFPFASAFRIVQSDNLTMPVLDQPASPDMLAICGPVSLAGSGLSPTTRLKVFLATSTGAIDLTPEPLDPTSTIPERWDGTLPCPWAVGAPNELALGQGFVALQMIDGDVVSNLVGIPLVGNAAQGIPSITAIDGGGLSATSWSPSIAVANVETVVPTGVPITVTGEGFDGAVVNVFTATGNCGPITPSGEIPTELTLTLPPACVTGPGSFQVVNTTTFRASNAVSAPIGAAVTIDAVTIDAGRVTVTGTGLSALSVINLFATSTGTAQVENLGGLDGGGIPRIAITLVDDTELAFDLPAEAAAGAAFVEAINPPYIPFSGSGLDPDGAFTIP